MVKAFVAAESVTNIASKNDKMVDLPIQFQTATTETPTVYVMAMNVNENQHEEEVQQEKKLVKEAPSRHQLDATLASLPEPQ